MYDTYRSVILYIAHTSRTPKRQMFPSHYSYRQSKIDIAGFTNRVPGLLRLLAGSSFLEGLMRRHAHTVVPHHHLSLPQTTSQRPAPPKSSWHASRSAHGCRRTTPGLNGSNPPATLQWSGRRKANPARVGSNGWRPPVICT